MNRELREMLNKINAKKAEIKNMIEKDDLEGAKAAKKELDTMQEKFDLAAEVIGDDPNNAKKGIENNLANPANNEPKPKARSLNDTVRAFANSLRNVVRGGKPTDEYLEIIKNEMNESDPNGSGESNGGLTVPQDIRTQIMELKRTSDDLEQYVNVETTKTNSGSRVIEVSADTNAYDEIGEGEEYNESDTPLLKLVKYKIKKYGGIHKLTTELLADTAEAIMSYLKKWIAKKVRATRNKFILAKLDEITKGKEIPVNDIDELKDIFNTMLDPAIKASSRIITNQDGFNYLDKLKDKDGNYLLQKDPTDETKERLFKKYEVVTVSNKVLKSEESGSTVKVPMYCGDTKEAITLFDREKMTIESNPYGKGWEEDKVPVKVRDRFDVVSVDEEAVIKAQITINTAG